MLLIGGGRRFLRITLTKWLIDAPTNEPKKGTKREIEQLAIRVSPARSARNTRKTRVSLRRASEPGGAYFISQLDAVYSRLSFVLFSLTWLFTLARVLT
jgi:hypothetical protein